MRITAAATMPGGWLRSGDLGYVREDGALVLTGRAKDVYKCGGELVMPTEVEACLTRHPGIAQAYVVGVPDPRMGEVGCAWIVPAEQAELDAEEVIGYCRAELGRLLRSGSARVAERARIVLACAENAGSEPEHAVRAW